jgi:hypothetical protein
LLSAGLCDLPTLNFVRGENRRRIAIRLAEQREGVPLLDVSAARPRFRHLLTPYPSLALLSARPRVLRLLSSDRMGGGHRSGLKFDITCSRIIEFNLPYSPDKLS